MLNNEVTKEQFEVINDLKVELDQERVISDGFESTIKDFEELVGKIYAITEDSEIKKMIDNFRVEHAG